MIFDKIDKKMAIRTFCFAVISVLGIVLYHENPDIVNNNLLIFVLLIAFFLFREVTCWYHKINKRVELLETQILLMRKENALLGSIKKLMETQNRIGYTLLKKQVNSISNKNQ